MYVSATDERRGHGRGNCDRKQNDITCTQGMRHLSGVGTS